MSQHRPNVLYLHTHDTGRRLEPYGHDAPAPNIQAFADHGVLFENAFCVGPTCSPSRAALMTGQYPHQCGQWGLANLGYLLPHPERTLPSIFRDVGYHTALLGVQHLHVNEHGLGYTEVRNAIKTPLSYSGENNPARLADQLTPAALDWLEQHHRDSRPWFLDVGFVETHVGSWRTLPGDEVPDSGAIEHATPPAGLPDIPQARLWQARHQVLVHRFDQAVGQIVAALNRLGLTDNTIVVLTTDHGVSLPLHKCSLRDGGLEVALALRGPGFGAGRACDAMVTHLDLFPTLCDACHIPRPQWLQGQSLIPLVHGECDTLHNTIYAELNVHGGPQPERCVRTVRHKLIRRWWTDPEAVRRNWDRQPIHMALDAANYFDDRLAAGRPVPDPNQPGQTEAHDLLFDLERDPHEWHDRSTDPEYGDIYNDLATSLEAWMQRTDDTFIPGGAGIPEPGEVLHI